MKVNSSFMILWMCVALHKVTDASLLLTLDPVEVCHGRGYDVHCQSVQVGWYIQVASKHHGIFMSPIHVECTIIG